MDFVRLLLALISFVGLPIFCGFLLLRIIRPEKPLRFTEYIPLAFALGLGLWVWLSTAGYVLNLNIAYIGVAFLAITLLLLAIAFIRRRSARGVGAHGDRYLPILVVILIVVGVLHFFIGAHQTAACDSFRHLAFVERLVTNGTLNGEIFQISASFPRDLRQAAYSYNGIYPLYSVVANVFDVRAAELWLRLPMLLAPLFMLTFYLFFRGILGSKPLALATLLLLLTIVWFRAFAGDPLRSTVFPRLIGYLVFIALLTEILGLLDREKPSWILRIVSAAAAAGLFAIHIQIWIFFMLTVGLLMVHSFLRGQRRAAGWLATIIVLALLLTVFPALLKIQAYFPVAGELEASSLAYYGDVFYYVGSFYALRPFELQGFGSDSVAIAIIALAVLLLAIRRKAGSLPFVFTYSASVIVTIAVLLLCPLTVPLISRFASAFMPFRLMYFMHLWGLVLFMAILHRIFTEKRPFRDLLERPWRSFGYVGVVVLCCSTLIVRPLLHILGSEFELLFWAAAAGFYIFVCAILIVIKLIMKRLEFRVDLQKLSSFARRKEMRIAWTAFLAYLAIFLLLPRSQLNMNHLADWNAVRNRLQGPSLEQILSSEQLRRMFESIEDKSVILMDRPNRDVLQAFKDIYKVAATDERTGAGKAFNEKITGILDYRTPVDEVLSGILQLSPDYLVLSPFRSHLGWMRFDNYPGAFKKVFDERIDNIDFLNRRYVVYKIDRMALSALAASGGDIRPQEPGEHEATSEGSRAIPASFSSELDLTNEDQWNETSRRIVWEDYNPQPWYYFEYDLQSEYENVEITWSPALWNREDGIQGIAIFVAGEDLKFDDTYHRFFDEPFEPGDDLLRIHVDARGARYIRVALESEKLNRPGRVDFRTSAN